jgi:8-hydroxy-5-deazaflavin:NADPH oxidoreductase
MSTNIGIIGSGNVARAIALGFKNRGYEVKLSARNPVSKKTQLEDENHTLFEIVSFEEVLDFGEILVIAVEGLAIEEIFMKINPSLTKGKIIIDVTNPLVIVDKNIRFGRATGDSNGKLIQAMLPGSRVVKALNTVNAHDMYKPEFNEGVASMLICGDDLSAKARVTKILQEFGWVDIVDIGGVEYSFEMESYVALWVKVAKVVGSFHLSMKFLKD